MQIGAPRMRIKFGIGAPRLFFVRPLMPLRHFLTAVILSVSISGLLDLNQVHNDNRRYFAVDIASSTDGLVQVYYDRGQGFREEDSGILELHVSKAPLTYRFLMPTANIKALRFDPSRSGGIFVVSNPKFVNGFNTTIRSLSWSSFSSTQQIDRMSHEGDQLRLEVAQGSNDPWMYVSLEPPLRPWIADWKSIEIDVRSTVSSALLVAAIVFALVFAEAKLAARYSRFVICFLGWARRSPYKVIAVVAAVSVLLSCYPVVFFGKSFVAPNDGSVAQLYETPPYLPGHSDLTSENVRGSDVGAMMWEHRPYSVIQHRALLDGELPLWNHYNSAGTPLLGQGLSMIGDPVHWVTIAANGAAWSWDAKFLIAKFLFCASTGFLLFIVTGGLTSALVITSSSAFLGFFIYRFNHPAFFSMCYAPMILLAWAGLLRAKTFKEFWPVASLLVLSIMMELNSGTAKESFILVIFLNGTGALALLLQRWSWQNRVIRLGLLCAIGLATILLLAPFWLIFHDELQRAYTLSNEPAAFPFPARLFAGFLDEIFYAQADPARDVMGPSVNLLIGVLLLWGIICAPRLRQDPWYMACLIGGTLSALMAFGVIAPSWIVKIPILKNVRSIGPTLSCVLLIQSLVVAGFGIRGFSEQASSEAWRRSCLATIFLGLAIAVSYASHISQLSQWSAIPMLFGAIALVGVMVLLGLWRQIFSEVITARNVRILLVCFLMVHLRLGQQLETGVAAIDLYVANPHQRPDFSVRSSALEVLPPSDHSPYRVTGIGAVSFPGYQATLGLEGINGADALWSTYFRELTDLLGIVRSWGWLTLVNEDELQRVSKGLDVLNVRYLLFPRASKLPADSSVVARSDLTVVERPTAWPRAYFDDNLLTYSDANGLAELFAASQKPIAAVQAGEKDVPDAVTGEGLVVAATDYKITSNSITFSVDAPKKGVVVLGETFFERSFIATLNGKKVDWFRVNHAFKGIFIPEAGKYVISFTYRPPLFDLSLLLSAIGAGLFAAFLVFVPWVEKRTGSRSIFNRGS
jgi:hypothetical protein